MQVRPGSFLPRQVRECLHHGLPAPGDDRGRMQQLRDEGRGEFPSHPRGSQRSCAIREANPSVRHPERTQECQKLVPTLVSDSYRSDIPDIHHLK